MCGIFAVNPKNILHVCNIRTFRVEKKKNHFDMANYDKSFISKLSDLSTRFFMCTQNTIFGEKNLESKNHGNECSCCLEAALP